MGCCCGGTSCCYGGQEHEENDLLGLIFGKLEAWPVLVIGGLSLLASFLLIGRGCGGSGVVHAKWSDPAFLAVLLCGLPLMKAAVHALAVERKIRSSLLISCAMVACLAIGQVFAAGEVAFIMALGEKLEAWTLRRAKRGLAKLVSLVPKSAHRVVTCPKCRARGEFFKDVAVEAIVVGDGVVVKPGEAIPVDGVVQEGETEVDQSAMTGESLPVAKKIGDEVYSGSMNRFGEITVKATKVGENSSIQRLVRLVKEAERKQAPMQRLADKWAAIIVPAALALACVTFLGCWLVLGEVETALIRGVTIMVVFCPCALALATPTSIMAAIGQATKEGVIVKSGEALERMGAVTVACFDKTGTLQVGERLRDGAKETVAALRACGVRTLMLSGDHEDIARRFAAGAGIDEVRFGCKPEDKSRFVEELQRRGEKVVMIGDGINDSIALKVADVGIAMGGMGTDIAQEAADVSLVTDDLSAIPYLKRLSVACVKLIKVNIAVSMAINACAIVCSALGLLGPVSGALVHNVGSVLVVLNGALLYDRKFR